MVQSLNGNIIGGKKGSYYHDDIWSMKYLPRFKWSNLTEKLAYDSAVRKKKLLQELTQVKKETNFYFEQMDKNKQVTAIKRKREEKLNLSSKLSDNQSKSLPNSRNDVADSAREPKQRRLVDPSSKSGSLTNSVFCSVFTQ